MADGELHESLGAGRRRRANARAQGGRSPTRNGAAGDLGRGGQAGNCRYDSSLGLLTKKFVGLVESAPDGVLDLNKAAENLQVQKRRIYDITNVLEGIGLIEKKSKNNIKWKGSSAGSADEPNPEVVQLSDDINHLQTVHEKLEKLIEEVKEHIEHMSAHPPNKSRIYVTSAEILALPSVGNDTVFAVTAPQGTTLSVPNPQDAPDGYRYRADLRSTTEPIEVWLVSKPKGESAGVSVEGAPAPDVQAAGGNPAMEPQGGLLQQENPSTPLKVKMEDPALFGLLSPSSPGGFMRLAAVDVDAYWYDNEDPHLGVADIFKDDPALT